LKKIIIFPVLIVLSLLQVNCEGDLENKIVVRNLSQSQLIINFRGNHYEISSTTEYNIKDIPAGLFNYSTIFSVPNGATFATEGDVSGQIEFKQGTRALIIYTNTFIDSTYTIYASLTTNTNLNNPVEP
jgi:hypothetical protein